MKVSVFCSSTIQPDSAEYRQAYALGRGLALAGHSLLSGGYHGSMAAVSRGAREAGGEAIGVTCEEIERWRPVQPNPWLTHELKYATLLERLSCLATHCDLAAALPGGIGTLTEIMLVWNLQAIAARPRAPILLISPAWQEVLQQFQRSFAGYIPERDLQDLVYCRDEQQALEHIAAMQATG